MHSLRMRPVVFVFDTAAGTSRIRKNILEPSWLDRFKVYKVEKIGIVSDTR